MKYLAILLALTLTCCATLDKAPGIYDETNEFTYYTESYLKHREIHLGSRTTRFAINISCRRIQRPQVAQCHRPSEGFTREIFIDPAYWASITENMRFNIIYHELGHCDLDVEHQDLVYGVMNRRVGYGGFSELQLEHFFREGL